MKADNPLVDRVLDRLQKVKRSGSGWSAQCPAHEDRNPSLTVAEGEEGRVLLNCHRGCSVEAIADAIGLSVNDLFPEKEQDDTRLEFIEAYNYLDAQGNEVFQVMRFVDQYGRKTFRQRHKENGSWVYTTTGIKRPLYRLPRVIDALEEGKTIWVVEGEKDVHALESIGEVATCNPGGAGKWLSGHSESLMGATQINIIADRDRTGRNHVQSIYDDLLAHGIKPEAIRTFQPPEGAKDIADLIAENRSTAKSRLEPLVLGDIQDDPFMEVVEKVKALLPRKELTMDQKMSRVKSLLDKLAVPGEQSGRGRLVRWDRFLNEPTPEYDWVIPDVLERGERVILVASEGLGKALALDTPIPTPTGWTTMGEIRPGDEIIGGDGTPCRVTFATGVQRGRVCYKVRFSDGAEIVADEEHLWVTQNLEEREKRLVGSVRTTRQIRNSLRSGRASHAAEHAIETVPPIELPEVDLPIPPYTFGAWLGDGISLDGAICSEDKQVLTNIELDGFEVRHRPSTKNIYGILGLKLLLRSNNLLGNKYILEEYLRASFKQRLALLQGLMDTDGHVTKDGICEFTSTNSQIANGALELLLSLGIKATMGTGRAGLYGKDCGQKFRIYFRTDLSACRLDRKAERLPAKLPTNRANLRYIVAVEPVETVPVKCIQVNSKDETFVVGREFIRTHNTMLLRQVALMSAAGIHPFRRDKMPPIRTLFFDLENPERIIRRTSKKMMERIRWYAGTTDVDAHLVVKPDGIDLLKPEGRQLVEEYVATIEPDLILFGPMYKAYIAPSDKSSEAVTTEVAKYFDYIRDAYKCALWLEHHAPLGGMGTTRDMRPFGSSVWMRWSEFGLALYPDITNPYEYEVKHYRGMRDERQWPRKLKRGEMWPFEVVEQA